MPKLLICVLLLALASVANGACRIVGYGRTEGSPDFFASSIAKAASVVMDAEVVQAEKPSTGTPAVLKPLRIYKGPRQLKFTMYLPPPSDEIITESYQGFGEPVGTRGFFVLFGEEGHFITDVCDDVAIEHLSVRRMLMRKLAR